MARYFFDIFDGEILRRDSEGSDCDGHEGIRLEAMGVLPTIANHVIPTDGNKQSFTVLVRNEKDVTVYTATLTFAGLWIGDVPIPDRD